MNLPGIDYAQVEAFRICINEVLTIGWDLTGEGAVFRRVVRQLPLAEHPTRSKPLTFEPDPCKAKCKKYHRYNKPIEQLPGVAARLPHSWTFRSRWREGAPAWIRLEERRGGEECRS